MSGFFTDVRGRAFAQFAPCDEGIVFITFFKMRHESCFSFKCSCLLTSSSLAGWLSSFRNPVRAVIRAWCFTRLEAE